MTEPTPEPDPFPWLTSAAVLDWLGLTVDDPADKLASAELCRQAAADWCEDQRPDLLDRAHYR